MNARQPPTIPLPVSDPATLFSETPWCVAVAAIGICCEPGDFAAGRAAETVSGTGDTYRQVWLYAGNGVES